MKTKVYSTQPSNMLNKIIHLLYAHKVVTLNNNDNLISTYLLLLVLHDKEI